MRNGIILTNQTTADNQDISTLDGLLNFPEVSSTEDAGKATFYSGEQEILASYARRLCVGKESEMIELSSSHHYFYDAEEMKNVKVVTSLKELNRISDLKGFLHSVYFSLQPKTFFIGHFSNNNKIINYIQNAENQQRILVKKNEEIENGISSRFPLLNWIYNILDAKAFNILSPRTVELYLRNCGFKVIDMTVINGTTCFCAQRLPSVD